TVTKAGTPWRESQARPRAAVIVTRRPSTAFAAVTPRHTMTRGSTSHISRSNQGRHASTSSGRGLSWMRRFAPGSPPFHLKCLARFRAVQPRAIDARLRQRPVQKPPRRADERATGEILVIARLLADHNHVGARIALAEHRLGRALVEVAGRAAGGRSPEVVQRVRGDLTLGSGRAQLSSARHRRGQGRPDARSPRPRTQGGSDGRATSSAKP